MIRHDDEGIQFDGGKMGRNVQPTPFGHAAKVIQPHFTTHDVAKQSKPPLPNAVPEKADHVPGKSASLLLQ